MTNTIFSGYLWERYSHMSHQNDGTGMIDPLPTTSGDYLKVNSDAGEDFIGKCDTVKQYYLWSTSYGEEDRGVVTTKRNPIEMTLSDIVGTYSIDDGNGHVTPEYIGIENMHGADSQHWVRVATTSGDDLDTLRLQWDTGEGESGVDEFSFVEELTDISFIDTPSKKMEEYCFHFLSAGEIEVTLTNLNNYVIDDGARNPINLYSGTSRVWRVELYQYNSNGSTFVTSSRVNSISPTSPTASTQNSLKTTLAVPGAGFYYIKVGIGLVGVSNGYYFSMDTSDLMTYQECTVECVWSLHVRAKETMPDNMCVSVYNYLNYWYEKSGNDERFDPKNIDANYFGQKFGWGNAIDKQQRVLWNDNNGTVPKQYVENFYPVKCVHDCNVHTADVNDYDVPRLICVSDIPDFEIFKFGFNGTITYPNKPSGTVLLAGTDMGRGTTKITIDLTPIYWSDDFEPTETCNAVDIYDMYYESSTYGDLTLASVGLTFEVLTRFPWVYDSPYAGNAVTFGDQIPVTFSNGTSYIFRTQSTSKYNTISYQPTFTLNLNDQWRQSTLFMSGKTIYESFSNYNVNNGTATMTIDIYGYKKFSLYIRSNAETTYDYVMVSQLDQSITGSTTYSNTTLVKAHTRGNQQTGNNLSNYTLVTYDNIDGGSHTITIVYRKDGSKNSGTDRGYIIIGDDTEPYVEYLSTIHAKYVGSYTELIDLLGPITAINYSNLKFKSTTSGGIIQQVEHYLNFMEYTLMTGVEGNLATGISLSSYDDEYEIEEYVGSFISLDGETEYMRNVNFRIALINYSEPVIAIKTSDLTSVFGKDCYFRFPIRVKSTEGIIELCLRVSVTETEFIIINEQIGDCTIWLRSGLTDTGLYCSNQVYLVNNDNDTVLYLCPMKGSYFPRYYIGDGLFNNIFAHGHLYINDDYLGIRTLYYEGEFYETLIVADRNLFSFIPTSCSTISDLGIYMHNSMPYIQIHDGFM